MPLIDLPPQVQVECDGGGDWCVHELECDGITLYFPKESAASAIGDYEWRVAADGKVYCESCWNPWCDACDRPLGRGSCTECKEGAHA